MGGVADEPSMRASPEFELIAKIRERLARAGAGSGADAPERIRLGAGDDAAITVPGGATATTIDATVEGIHFRSGWCPPHSVGRKAMATALSDLAAMGAEPGEAYVWVGRPPWLDPEGVLELCDGLAAVAAAAGVAIAGGDLTAAPELAVSVTAVGHAPTEADFVRRSGAEPGDALCVTGALGGAAAGLMLLEHPDLGGEEISAEADVAACQRQLDPRPRIEAGRLLAGAGAKAMIDVSDGLGADAEHLAEASGVAIEIELERVPLATGVAEIAAAAGRDVYEFAAGGEDYELLVVLPRSGLQRAASVLEPAGVPLAEIGRITAGRGVRLRLPGGRSLPMTGHDQLRS